MTDTPENIHARLEAVVQPGYRDKLIAKGLARGMIWRDGILPADAPHFSTQLTTDLLDHGFHALDLSLRLRDLHGDQASIRRGLYTAAEAIESAVRYGNPIDVERGFLLAMAAAAFHIGGYSARAFTLFEGDLAAMNLASYEQSLVRLMRRDLARLRQTTGNWLNTPSNSDVGIVQRLAQDGGFTADDAIAVVLTRTFHTAIASFDAALLSGNGQLVTAALAQLQIGRRGAADANHVPLWWSFTIARHLMDDLWSNTLHVVLPKDGGPPRWPEFRRAFIDLLASRNVAEVDLWPSQIDAAARVINTADDLVVALPTSAGKTRIAELCILRTLAEARRVIYVTPLRALSAQVESALAGTFRPLGYSVTSVYGASGVALADLETLKSAAIVVATPEKLDFAIRQDPTLIDDVGLIVLDEGHMIGLSEREIRYEMLVQRLLRRSDADNRRLVCLSAVFSEGEPFDDFTAWIRSDAPGTAVRSTWRPTRQRPGTLVWQTTGGRLELEVEDETPFVPRFVEPRPGLGKRRKVYPADAQELLVAATSTFLGRGQSVMIYCPQKRSVEATASAFLKAYKSGYFVSQLAEVNRDAIADAVRLGKEWLGVDHPAVASLSIGIGVHHGSLPRQFLGEIEGLLKRRILPVCICSPTLAQGLDLSFSVLLFRSIYRKGNDPIAPKEFANVVGRVGRAFVDLDGLYVLPIFEDTPAKAATRKRDFRNLINAAKQRKLESGVFDLIRHIIRVLGQRLGFSESQLAEYVLNANSTWQIGTGEDDQEQAWLDAALNELDTAILGIVDALELPVEQVADYLDTCLASSYWQRRLLRHAPAFKALQETVMRGRAQWIWNKTDAAKRKGFFAAGVGYKAGTQLEDHAGTLRTLLQAAEDALAQGSIDEAVASAIALATIVFQIGPFQPSRLPEHWEGLLGNWLRGNALSAFSDNDGIRFLQDAVVFRLVWGVEAARLHLHRSTGGEAEPPGGNLALCLTYGVPNRQAALFMQAGLRSRVQATSAAAKVGIVFNDTLELRLWIQCLRDRVVPPVEWMTADERREWGRFLERFDHHYLSTWRLVERVLNVKWLAGTPPTPGALVRIMRTDEKGPVTVSTTEFTPLGEAPLPDDIRSNHFLGTVQDDQASIGVSFFGT